MTVIVGLNSDSATYMGGDASASDDSSIEIRKEPKVWFDGHWIVGVSPSFRMSQMVQYQISLDDLLPSPANCKQEDLVNDLVPPLQNLFRGDMTIPEDGWRILMGGQGYLWEMQEDFSVAEVETCTAIGSGVDYALGALHVLQRCQSSYSQPIIPRLKVLYACRAASHHSLSVAPPFTILKSERRLPNVKP